MERTRNRVKFFRNSPPEAKKKNVKKHFYPFFKSIRRTSNESVGKISIFNPASFEIVYGCLSSSANDLVGGIFFAALLKAFQRKNNVQSKIFPKNSLN